jgi:hypothetical protein
MTCILLFRNQSGLSARHPEQFIDHVAIRRDSDEYDVVAALLPTTNLNHNCLLFLSSTASQPSIGLMVVSVCINNGTKTPTIENHQILNFLFYKLVLLSMC